MAGTGQFYVYELIDPRDGVPFYVGKGQALRVQHEWGRGFAARQRMGEIRAAGHEVAHRIVSRFESEDLAYEFEAAHIAKLGVKNLTNVSNGGYGKRTIGAGWREFARKRGLERDAEIPVHLMDLGVGLPA